MEHKLLIRRYRNWYARLVRLYPKQYRERFGEGMEQTFSDIYREQAEAGRGALGSAAWMFLETSTGVIRENITFINMQNITKRMTVWALIVGGLLLIPAIAMLVSSEWNWTWSDFVFAAVFLYGAAFAYELISRRISTSSYRKVFGVAFLIAVALVWGLLATG